MTAGGRLLEFVFVCVTAAAITMGAFWLFPYFELVAPVAALIALMLAVNFGDGIRFAIQHRSRLALRGAPAQGQRVKERRKAA